jgi:hypothetical protein
LNRRPCFFYGASNVQNAGNILRIFNPRITVGHGAEHVVSLFFSDVYKKVPEFKRLSDFAKKVCNIFGLVRHNPSAMFKKYTRLHNKGIHIGFIKPSVSILNATFQRMTRCAPGRPGGGSPRRDPAQRGLRVQQSDRPRVPRVIVVVVVVVGWRR